MENIGMDTNFARIDQLYHFLAIPTFSVVMNRLKHLLKYCH